MSYQTKTYRTDGGDRQVIAAGGVLAVESGGVIQIAGVDKTSQLNLAVAGVAAGYKVARGTITPTTGSDTVVTGLATVVAAVASLKGAPSLTHMFVAADIGNQAGAPAAGSIIIKSYKPTGAADVTPIAATTPWSAVDWVCIGT